MTSSHRATAVGASVALILGSAAASADPTPQDSAAAQSLYDEARKLTSSGQWADACPKLQESQRLDPTPVTEFYLADCYEHVGRTASAWTTFLDLAAMAHRTGGPKAADRERVAKNRAAALESLLTKLQIDVPAAARVPGLIVKRDGEVVGEGQWSAPVAVDPGKHSIEASAPGKKPWTQVEDAQGRGQIAKVQVPALEDLPPPAAAIATTTTAASVPDEAPAAPTESRSSPLKIVGITTAGIGAAGLVVGAILGVEALSKNSDANKNHCGAALGFPSDPNRCDPQGVTLRSDAVDAGNLSTIGFAAGGALFAGGVLMWLLAPSAHVQAAPAVGSGSTGVVLRGNF
jgi:hypothetical protein